MVTQLPASNGGAPVTEVSGATPASKTSVDYRSGDALSRCGICSNFIAPDTCGVVEGKVSPDMLCNLYAPLDPTKQAQRDIPMPMPVGPTGPAGAPTGGALGSPDIMSQLFGGGIG